jgi:hypothetical protein
MMVVPNLGDTPHSTPTTHARTLTQRGYLDTTLVHKMKQRAAKKKQTKKVTVAKRKQTEAKKKLAAAAAGGDGTAAGGNADGDVAMDAEVAAAAADEDVAIAEAEADAKPAGRAAHALKVQARRALKSKIESLKGSRQKIAKKNLSLKPERKAISRHIKGLLKGRAGAGDAAELAAAAAGGLPDDDDEWEEMPYGGGDDDVEMAA